MSRVALVLAAGAARRFGSDKLAAPLDGDPLVFHAIRAARAAPVARVIVVAHPQLDLGTWPGSPLVEVIRLASTALSETLLTGIAAAGEAQGVFVFLGDMPRVPHDIAAALAARIGTDYAAMPRHDGRPGHPVLLSRRALVDAAGVQGDFGAGKLLRDREDVAYVETADPRIHLDVDRPTDLARLAADAQERN